MMMPARRSIALGYSTRYYYYCSSRAARHSNLNWKNLTPIKNLASSKRPMTTSTVVSPPVSSSSPRVLIVGAAYAGLGAALSLLKICDGKPVPLDPGVTPIRAPDVVPQVTILDERDGIFHSMGTPLVHVNDSVTSYSWVRFRDIPALQRDNVKLLQGKITQIDPLQKKAFWRSGDLSTDGPDHELGYDYVVVATGLQREWPIVPRAVTRMAFLKDARNHIARLEGCRKYPIVVIGGGAVGTEFAAEIKHYHPDGRVVLIHSRQSLLSNEPLPDRFKEDTLNALRQSGVEVLLGCRVLEETDEAEQGDSNHKKTLRMSNGEELVAGYTLWATSPHLPRTDFLPATSLNQNGFVKVLSTMQFDPTTPNNSVHFAVGDIADWSGIRRVGRAFSLGRCAAVNIMKLMTAQTMTSSNNKTSHAAAAAAAAAAEQSKAAEATTDLQEHEVLPPAMALALGETALTYHPEMGIAGGPEVCKKSFGSDLGMTTCWGVLGLPLPVQQQ